jgi:uncharacterized protein (TIGR02996 family)
MLLIKPVNRSVNRIGLKMTPYDSPEYAAFIARIREQPDDDLPRLVAADWLEEQSEAERAALIRVQIQRGGILFLDNLPLRIIQRGNTYLDKWVACSSGHKGVKGWSKLFIHTLPRPLPSCRYDAEIRRGFLESLSICGAEWVKHADAILRVHPVRKVWTVMPGSNWDFPAIRWPGVEFTFEQDHPIYGRIISGPYTA